MRKSNQTSSGEDSHKRPTAHFGNGLHVDVDDLVSTGTFLPKTPANIEVGEHVLQKPTSTTKFMEKRCSRKASLGLNAQLSLGSRNSNSSSTQAAGFKSFGGTQ